MAPFVESSILEVMVGDIVDFTFVGFDPDNAPRALTWTFDGLMGRDGIKPALEPVFAPDTQRLLWNTAGSEIGTYLARVTAFDGDLSGSGTLTINVSIPEPAPQGLCTFGIFGLVWWQRKRPERSSTPSAARGGLKSEMQSQGPQVG
jgi:hypothetical protein